MAPTPPDPLPFEHRIAVADIEPDGMPVRRGLDAAETAALARFLGIPAVEALDFEGRVRAIPGGGWTLSGRLTGTAVQSCVVTLDPVTEDIDAAVEREFRQATLEDEAEVLEIGPEDLDAPEPVGSEIDLATVMIEALALALSPYPRAERADFAGRVHAGPGVTPLTDEALRPFSGLAELRDRLSGGRDE